MLAWFQSLVGLMMGGVDYFYALTHSYGLAIIMLTIVVRLLLVPIYYNAMKSTRKMQMLVPEVEKIKAKYKGDSAKINEATMRLYKDNNVNLAMGCLPTLLQIPFIWALFDGLQSYKYTGNSAFLWIPSLTKTDPFYILPVLAALTTFFQVRMTLPPGGDKMQQRVTLFMMPAVIFYMSLKFPAGLSLYWVVSNVFAIVQQYFMMRRPMPIARITDDTPKT